MRVSSSDRKLLCGTLSATIVLGVVGAAPIGADTLPVFGVALSLGVDGKGELVDQPVAVDWSADGRAFVLAQGAGEVLVFDDEWNFLERFGQPGEGPGDIDRGEGIVVVGDGLCVLEASYLTWFSFGGDVLRKTQLPQELTQLVRPTALGSSLAAVAPAANSVAVRFEYSGNVTGQFGPECNVFSGTTGGMTCTAYLVEAGVSESVAAVLFDLVGSQVLVLDAALDAWSTVPLHLEQGRVWKENGATYWRTPLRATEPDGDGGYLLAVAPGGEPERSSWEIHRVDGAFALVARAQLPDDLAVYDLFVSPRGEICVLDKWDSAVHVLDQWPIQ